MCRDPCFKFLIEAGWYTWPRTHLLRTNKLPHTNDYPIGTHHFQPPERDISLRTNKLPHTNDYLIETHCFQPLERDISFTIEQNLGTVLRCCSLYSSLKILPCGFFVIDGSVFFKLNNHMTES